MMSRPLCYEHGQRAVHRNRNGYWFCPRCLDALFEWNQWIRNNLVLAERKKEMMTKNKEIAEKHKQYAREFALRNPEEVDPSFLKRVRSSEQNTEIDK